MTEATPGPSHPRGTPPGARAALRANHRPAQLRRRVPRLLVGLVLCGLGIASMVAADLGLGPWDVLHQGLSRLSGIPIGMVGILVGLVVLGLWAPLRERPGVGTVLNVIVIGVVIDLVLLVLDTPDHLDHQTEKIGVPLAYAHELYDLRQHIHGVRKRLQLQATGGSADSEQPAAAQARAG